MLHPSPVFCHARLFFGIAYRPKGSSEIAPLHRSQWLNFTPFSLIQKCTHTRTHRNVALIPRTCFSAIHIQSKLNISINLFFVSLFFSVSDSTILCLGYAQLWSLLVLFSHSFGMLSHFHLYYILCLCSNSIFFVPCFSSSFSLLLCVCVVVSFSQRKGPERTFMHM